MQMKLFIPTTTDEVIGIHRICSNRQPCDRGCAHNKQCTATGAKYYKCGHLNHFAKMCRTKTRSLYGIQTDESSNVATDMFIGAIQRNQNAKEWQITLTLNNQ